MGNTAVREKDQAQGNVSNYDQGNVLMDWIRGEVLGVRCGVLG